jgi:hypothetical protein
MAIVRGHTLEWGEPYRDLIAGKVLEGEAPFWPLEGLDCRRYMAALETRVQRDVALFKGLFTEYDVLNEVGGAVGRLGAFWGPFKGLPLPARRQGGRDRGGRGGAIARDRQPWLR